VAAGRAEAVIENPATGEQIAVVRHDAEILVLDDRWTRPGHRAAEHVHPAIEERIEVLEGRARFRVAGAERDLGPGDAVVVAPGVAHLGWNPREDEVRLRLELRPPLRWLEVVERLLALARDGRTDARGVPEPAELVALLDEFAAELAPPPG